MGFNDDAKSLEGLVRAQGPGASGLGMAGNGWQRSNHAIQRYSKHLGMVSLPALEGELTQFEGWFMMVYN